MGGVRFGGSFVLPLCYSDLLAHGDAETAYALKSCDGLSVVTRMCRLCSAITLSCVHDGFPADLSSCFAAQIKGIRKWSNAGTRGNRAVMNVCRIDRAALKALKTTGNLLPPIENALPEDLCFYRRGSSGWRPFRTKSWRFSIRTGLGTSLF